MRDGGTTPTLITERAPTTMAGAGARGPARILVGPANR